MKQHSYYIVKDLKTNPYQLSSKQIELNLLKVIVFFYNRKAQLGL